MQPQAIAGFEKMLAAGQDSVMLRFGLGNAYLQHGDAAKAAEHLAVAVDMQPDYSAAWKLYARALAESGASEQAVVAYHTGIDVAERNGDVQAGKEMRVFLKRLQKDLNQS